MSGLCKRVEQDTGGAGERVGRWAGERLEQRVEKMLLHKWTTRDKDFDIIIIKSERHHMARGKKLHRNNQSESLAARRKRMKRSFFSRSD